MRKKICFSIMLVMTFVYIFAGKQCTCKPIIRHLPNCQYEESIECSVTWDFAKVSLQSLENSEILITLPNWLSLDNIETNILFAAAANNSEGGAFAEVKLTPINTYSDANISLLKPVVSPELKETIDRFFDDAQPDQDIQIQSKVTFYNLLLTSVTNEVYEPFTYVVSYITNGEVYGQCEFSTSLSEIFLQYLSSAIDQLPDSAYVNNPGQRREALQNKLKAAINSFSAGNAKGAYQKIKQDIIPFIENFICDPIYKQDTIGALNKVASFIEPLS